MTRPAVITPPELGSGASGKVTLAVWKFASCDGCQLSLLDCEDELLTVADHVEIASFPEASSAMVDGPYDLSLVEGSITTPHDVERIREIRESSTSLVTIGACATSGGIQALRNGADVEEFVSIVYAHPAYISTLATSTGIADHVEVDFELRGCPIDRGQLLEVVTAYVTGRPPRLTSTSVCSQCKARSIRCVMVADGLPCLGPVTQAGCGALCPAYHRACYGCFGPSENPTAVALDERFAALGFGPVERERIWRGYAGWDPDFRVAAERAARDVGGVS